MGAGTDEQGILPGTQAVGNASTPKKNATAQECGDVRMRSAQIIRPCSVCIPAATRAMTGFGTIPANAWAVGRSDIRFIYTTAPNTHYYAHMSPATSPVVAYSGSIAKALGTTQPSNIYSIVITFQLAVAACVGCAEGLVQK